MAAPRENSPGGFDPEVYRPERTPEVELFDRGAGEGERRYVLILPSCEASLQLSPSEVLLWEMFDGQRTVSEICTLYLERHGALVLHRVLTLLELLWERGMLRGNPGLSFPRKSGPRLRLTHVGGFRLPGTGRLLRAAGCLLRPQWLASWPVLALVAVCLAAGFYGFQPAYLLEYPVFRLSRAYALLSTAPFAVPLESAPDGTRILMVLQPTLESALLMLLIMHLSLSFLREAVRGSMMAGFLCRSPRMQLIFNFGLPSFHVPWFWRLAMPLRLRLATSVAGLLTELLLASLCVWLLPHVTAPFAREVVARLLLLLLLRSFFHLSPVSVSDLHGLMSDWGDLPDFRRRAVGFLRHGLIPALFGDRVMSREQRFFLTFNCAAVVWLVLAARLGVDLLSLNRQGLRDAIANETNGPARLLLLVLLLLPIAFSLCVSLGWGLFLFYRWLGAKAFMRRPGNVILVVWCSLGVFVAWVLLLERANQFAPPVTFGIIFLANLAVLGLGVWWTISALRMERRGFTHFKLWIFLLLFFLGLMDLITSHYQRDSMLCILYLAAMLGVILFHTTFVVFRERRLLSCWRTRYGLPEISMMLGVLGFELAALLRIAGLLYGGEFPEFPLFTLLTYGMMVSGLLAWVNGMRHVHLSEEGLAVDLRHGETHGLISVGNEVLRAVGHASLDHFGRRAVRRIEEDMAAKAPGRRFRFDEPFFPSRIEISEIGLLFQELILCLQETLTLRYSQEFARAVLREAFHKVHWRGKTLLERYVLAGTPWAGAFRLELSLTQATRRAILHKVSLFDELIDKQLDELADNMYLEEFRRGEYVLRQGRAGETCCIIVSGEAEVQETDISGERRILALLAPGDFFGEAALLRGVVRSASIQAVTDLETLTLYRADFDKLGRRYPEMVAMLRDRLQSLHDLLAIPLFQGLPTNLLRGLLPRIRHLHYQAGQTVICEGDPGGAFYVIKSGELAVRRRVDGMETHIRKLKKGEYFGEIALLQKVPRTATVVCLKACELLVLEAEEFRRLVGGSAFLAATLNARR